MGFLFNENERKKYGHTFHVVVRSDISDEPLYVCMRVDDTTRTCYFRYPV